VLRIIKEQKRLERLRYYIEQWAEHAQSKNHMREKMA
jgi:hypothetical protein